VLVAIRHSSHEKAVMARAPDWEPGDLSLRVSPSTTLSGQVTSSLGVIFSIFK